MKIVAWLLRVVVLAVLATLGGWSSRGGASILPSDAQAALPPADAPQPVLTPGLPGGHIAFSFWNRASDRCTYEINVIDVAACLKGAGGCQANRRIFPLNNVSEPALSPSGDRIEFRGWGDPSSPDSPFIHCAPALKARYLANTTLDGTSLRGTGGFWEDSHPNWSREGGRILFDSTRHRDRISRIFVINPDGANEGDLRIAGQQPSWAPDNQRFVYRGCDLTGNRCGLWLAYASPVMSWDTGKNMIGPVVEDEKASHPDWSPVADEIVYQTLSSPLATTPLRTSARLCPFGMSPLRGEKQGTTAGDYRGNWDLMLVNARITSDGAGNTPRVLLAEPAIEGLPRWSPDGQWIAYVSDVGGNWGVWIIRRDGSERHQLFTFDGGVYALPKAWEPYGTRDWIDEQISWSR